MSAAEKPPVSVFVRPWARYALAVGAVAAGLLLRAALTAWVGPGLPTYITFYPAVMLAALLGGLRPGLLATALLALATDYWLLEPIGFFSIGSLRDGVGLGLFCCMGTLMSTVAHLYQRARVKAAAYDRELALRELRREQEFLARLLEDASQPFAVGYPDGRIGRFNRAFAELTGYTAAELRARDRLAAITPSEWCEAERQKLEELHRTGQPVRYEREYLRKDGSRVPVEVLVHLVRDAAGKPEYYYSFVADVTQRRRAAEAARAVEERLRQLNTQLWDANVTLQESRTAALNLMEDAVAARRQAEQAVAALRVSEERYRNLFEHAATGIAMTDCGGRFVECNAAYCQMIGYSPDELAALDFPALIYPDDREDNLGSVRRLLSGELPSFDIENRYVHKTGAIVWVHKYVSLLRDGADNPTHIVALVTDMTAGKLAEAELRRSIAETRAANEELDASRRAALNLMDDAVEARRLAEEASAELDRNRADLNRAQAVAHVGSWRLDVRRDELLWSEENHRIFGLPQGTPLTYETFLGVVHPDDRAYVDEQWSAALQGAPYDIEHRIVVGEQVKWVRERAELEFDDAGALLGGFGTTQDITEKKQVEEILQQAKAAAEAANEAKSRFLANISHELRTPMNAILGMVQLALQRQLDATAREFLTTARDSANVLLALLNDLLDSARIESGKLELETAPFSLRRMLDLTARVLEVRASEKGIAFSCRIADDVPDVYLGDELRLRQVLFNLTGNAVKFTERGEVTVDVRVASQDAQRACLEFAVRDTGIGISPADQERIFRPFAQADPSTTRRFGGTGLGLSISRSLVAMMDGRLWVESQLGQGSTFHFTVNLQWAGELVLEPAPEEIIAPVAAARLKLLLVEDNPANQKLAQFILRERGHEVEVVGDGARAVQLAAADCYDVILMDVQMPGMDGLEATAAIRQREAKQGLGIRDWGLVKEEPPTADSSPLILHPQSPIPSSPKFQSPIRLRRVPIIAMTAHAMAGDRERCLAAGMDGYLSKPIDGYEMIALVESLAGRKNLPQRRDAQSDGQLLDGDVGPMATVSFSPGAPDGDVFLLEEAHRRCFNNPGMFREMVGYFFKECETVFDEMHAALAAGDWNGLGRLGHRLKGTVVYLGAPQASEAAKRVEQFGELPGRPADGAEAVAALAAQCEVLKAALVEHRPAVDETH